MKCCTFCAENTDTLIYLPQKYHSWVLRPREQYPVCNLCLDALETDSISERINLKFKAKQTSLEPQEAKRLERLMNGKPNKKIDSRGNSVANSSILSEGRA